MILEASISDIEFDYEQVVMSIIVNAGQSRSCAFSAIQAAKSGDFAQAKLLLVDAENSLREAHQVQTYLIGQDEGQGKVPVHLIMVHAQDHLMNAILTKEIAGELIDVHQQLSALKERSV